MKEPPNPQSDIIKACNNTPYTFGLLYALLPVREFPAQASTTTEV